VSIEGVSEHTRRMQGINLSGGHTNAVEVCMGLFNMPSLDVLLEQFVIDNNIQDPDIEIDTSKYIQAIIPADQTIAKAISEANPQTES